MSNFCQMLKSCWKLWNDRTVVQLVFLRSWRTPTSCKSVVSSKKTFNTGELVRSYLAWTQRSPPEGGGGCLLHSHWRAAWPNCRRRPGRKRGWALILSSVRMCREGRGHAWMELELHFIISIYSELKISVLPKQTANLLFFKNIYHSE